MIRTSRSMSLAALAGVLGAFAFSFTPVAQAQELITPRVKDRKFPQELFCPMPFDAEFVADGSAALIRFSTNVYYDASGSVVWTQQLIDNICVAPLAVYNANLGSPGGYSSSCYVGEPIPQRFYFQNAGSIPLKEQFLADPTGLNTWDMDHGVRWEGTMGAPNGGGPGAEPAGPFDPITPPLGALWLGHEDLFPSRSLQDSAYTSIVVSGLTNGQTYVVSGWWDVRRMDLEEIFLTLRVYGFGATPVLRETWGGLKRKYR